MLNPAPPSAGHGSQATAGTLPPHAKTGAVTPKNVNAPPPGATDKPVTPPSGGKPNNQVGSGNAGYYTKPNQFKLGPGQKLGFTAGRGYYARNTPTPPPTRRPVSQTPQQQALRQVTQSLAPFYKQMNSQNAAQDTAIKNFSTSLLQQLGGMPDQVHQEYANAIGQQQNLVDAAANSLRAANPDAQVQNDLSAIGAPQAQQQAVGNQINTAFNGNAALGQYTGGVLPLGSLRSQGLTAETLARLQPGIEGLRAQQALAGALYQQGQNRLKFNSQVPGLVQRYLAANQSYSQRAQQLGIERAALGIRANQGQQRLNQNSARIAQGNARLAQDNARLDLQVKKANVAIDEWNAKQTAATNKIDTQVSRGFGDGFAHNAQGQVVFAGGKPIKFNAQTATVSTKGQLSDNEIVRLIHSAHDGKLVSVKEKQPNPDTNGNPVYKSVSVQTGQMNYGQVYQQLRASGVPDQKARQMLNTVYQRGELGRAWVSNREQAILSKSGLPPRATIMKGQAVLTPKQTAVLSAAGALPPGQRTAEGFFVIAKGY